MSLSTGAVTCTARLLRGHEGALPSQWEAHPPDGLQTVTPFWLRVGQRVRDWVTPELGLWGCVLGQWEEHCREEGQPPPAAVLSAIRWPVPWKVTGVEVGTSLHCSAKAELACIRGPVSHAGLGLTAASPTACLWSLGSLCLPQEKSH